MFVPSSIANVTDNLSADGAGEIASWATRLDFLNGDDFLLLDPVLLAFEPDTLLVKAALGSTRKIPAFLSSLWL